MSRLTKSLVLVVLSCPACSGNTPLAVEATKAEPSYEGKSLHVWMEQLQAKEPEVRAEAVSALGVIGPEAKEAVPQLIEALQDKDKPIRLEAIEALGRIGLEAKSAKGPLHNALKDQSPKVCMAATLALARIDPEYAPKAVATLIEALKSVQEEGRAAAIASLGNLGPKARAAVPDLIEMLKDDDTAVRTQAVTALGQIGPDAKSAVPALHDILKDPNAWNERPAVYEALRKIDPAEIWRLCLP
jgi:HEAT repeat protein